MAPVKKAMLSVSLPVGQQLLPPAKWEREGFHCSVPQPLLDMENFLVRAVESCGRCPCAGCTPGTAGQQSWQLGLGQGSLHWSIRGSHSRAPGRGRAQGDPALCHDHHGRESLLHLCSRAMDTLLRAPVPGLGASSSQSHQKPLNHLCAPMQGSLTSLNVTQHIERARSLFTASEWKGSVQGV